MKKLFIFGLGYAAQNIAQNMRTKGWETTGTHRKAQENGFVYSDHAKLNDGALQQLSQADAVLLSIPPDEDGDKVFRDYAALLERAENLRWLGLFSTTGVYGDADGEWVDEHTQVKPQTQRDENRLLAEQQWLATTLPVHVFRLSGIYGPGRSALDRARDRAPLVNKPGHVFNRIHVADISRAVTASINHPTPQEIYNLSDDLPAPGEDVMRHAYALLNLAPSKVMPFEQAQLSPMAKEFYAANKRVKADKIKRLLGLDWLYPDYKSGLQALFIDEQQGFNVEAF